MTFFCSLFVVSFPPFFFSPISLIWYLCFSFFLDSWHFLSLLAPSPTPPRAIFFSPRKLNQFHCRGNLRFRRGTIPMPDCRLASNSFPPPPQHPRPLFFLLLFLTIFPLVFQRRLFQSHTAIFQFPRCCRSVWWRPLQPPWPASAPAPSLRVCIALSPRGCACLCHNSVLQGRRRAFSWLAWPLDASK